MIEADSTEPLPGWLRRHGTTLLIFGGSLLAAGVIVWDQLVSHRQFVDFQIRRMQSASDIVANHVTHKINDVRNTLRLFADANVPLLQRLRDKPDDPATFDDLAQRLQAYLPDYHGLTLTDAQGAVLFDDFGERVGDLCRADIRAFTQSFSTHEPYIHPGPSHYHIDIMAPWGGTPPAGALSASFRPALIATILQENRREGFRLVLTRADDPTLIEIVESGGRDQLGEQIRLSADEQATIAYTRPVPGTRWTINAIPDATLFSAHAAEARRDAGFEGGALLLLALLSAILLERARSRREQAEAALRTAHAELEQRVILRTEDLRQTNHRLEQEIEERARAEAHLRKLGMAVEQTADSIGITNSKGVIEYVNAAFERVTGYRADEVIGKTFAIVKSGHHSEAFYRDLWHTISSGDVFREVMINRRKDGSLYYEEKTITPLKNDAGRIIHYVTTGKDITDRMKIQERLHYLAHHDVLTGLPNRALFHDRLDHAMMQARRNNRLVALLFLDLDNFKSVNDTLGHAAGDNLLDEVAGRLKNCVRESDTVARLGGDEFAVILESIGNASAAATTAKTILDCVVRTYRLDGHDIRVTASIGITLFPEDADNRENLCRNADTAMYRAKELGRNNFQFFTTDLTARATARMAMENRLHNALEHGEFAIHYQPKMNLSNRSTMGMEALLRWHNPDLGQVSPEVFIPILESTGLIVEVGDWVLENACRFTQQLHSRGHSVSIAVNLSARQIVDAELPSRIRKLLAATRLAAEALELEITESLLMENLGVAVEALSQLNDIGVRIAIDDFGTGYSSLAYLKRLPIDTLKIDRTFVRDVPDNTDDVAIVTAIIALARSLQLDIVAEGIETEGQASFLASLGCAFGQGYLFSRPLPPQELLAWIESSTSVRSAVLPEPIITSPA